MITDEILLGIWHKNGGTSHGPNVETLTMPYSKIDGITKDINEAYRHLVSSKWMPVRFILTELIENELWVLGKTKDGTIYLCKYMPDVAAPIEQKWQTFVIGSSMTDIKIEECIVFYKN